MVYLSVLSQHRETAAVCGNHYAASAELPLLINHTPRWPCKQQQQQLCNAAHRKLSYECDICKQTMLLGWLFGNCLLCCACPSNGSPGGASRWDMENSWSPASRRKQPPQRQAQGSELELSTIPLWGAAQVCCRWSDCLYTTSTCKVSVGNLHHYWKTSMDGQRLSDGKVEGNRGVLQSHR